jgi:hypothetical protein
MGAQAVRVETLTAILAASLALPAPAFAGPSQSIPILYSMDDARAGAELRANAAVVIPIVFNPCGSSSAMEPTIQRFRAFVADLPELSQSMDMAIARADYDYQMSLVDLLCPDTALPEYHESEKLNIAIANDVLDRMDQLVEPRSGQDN